MQDYVWLSLCYLRTYVHARGTRAQCTPLHKLGAGMDTRCQCLAVEVGARRLRPRKYAAGRVRAPGRTPWPGTLRRLGDCVARPAEAQQLADDIASSLLATAQMPRRACATGLQASHHLRRREGSLRPQRLLLLLLLLPSHSWRSGSLAIPGWLSG